MTRGFYTLGSGMITQNRMLSAISNNIANVKTPGFKKDTILSQTFGEMVMNRVDGQITPLGTVSMLRSADEQYTIHSQGMLDTTERNLDFALVGSGFFQVQGDNGTVFTRNGSFNIDNEGYLILSGVGRVMGENGPIQIGTDNFTADENGNLFSANGAALGSIAVYDFENYAELLTVGDGMYNAPNSQRVENPLIKWQTIESSNVDVGQEMTNSIATQRILQSIAQSLQMYDSTMQSATTQIGKV